MWTYMVEEISKFICCNIEYNGLEVVHDPRLIDFRADMHFYIMLIDGSDSPTSSLLEEEFGIALCECVTAFTL